LHLSEFIGLKLHDIGHEDGKLVFTFSNNAKILCRIGQKDFYIKKEINRTASEKKEEAEKIKEAKAEANKRSKEISRAKATGTKVSKRKISPKKKLEEKPETSKKKPVTKKKK